MRKIADSDNDRGHNDPDRGSATTTSRTGSIKKGRSRKQRQNTASQNDLQDLPDSPEVPSPNNSELLPPLQSVQKQMSISFLRRTVQGLR